MAWALRAFHEALDPFESGVGRLRPTNYGQKRLARAALRLARELAEYDAAGGRYSVGERTVARAVHRARRKFDERIDRWGWCPVISSNWKAHCAGRLLEFYRNVRRRL